MKHLRPFVNEEISIGTFLKKKFNPNSFKKLLLKTIKDYTYLSGYVSDIQDGKKENIVVIHINKDRFQQGATQVVDNIEAIFDISVENPELRTLRINLLHRFPNNIPRFTRSDSITINKSKIELSGSKSIYDQFRLIIEDIQQAMNNIIDDIESSRTRDALISKAAALQAKKDAEISENNNKYLEKMKYIYSIKDELSDYFVYLEEASTSFTSGKIESDPLEVKFIYNIPELNKEKLNINDSTIRLITDINTAKKRLQSDHPNIDVDIELLNYVSISLKPKDMKYITYVLPSRSHAPRRGVRH